MTLWASSIKRGHQMSYLASSPFFAIAMLFALSLSFLLGWFCKPQKREIKEAASIEGFLEFI